MDFLVEYLPLQLSLATVFQAGDPGTAVMKIDPKQMSVNNEAEANLWLEQTLNENLTRASCHLDIDQRRSSHPSPSPLLHLPLHNETLQPGNQGDSRYYNYTAPPLPFWFWYFFLLHWMLKPLATYQLITLDGLTNIRDNQFKILPPIMGGGATTIRGILRWKNIKTYFKLHFHLKQSSP